MIDLYKYVHGIYNTSTPLFQLSENQTTRGNLLKLAKDQCRRQLRSNFFSLRVVNIWNSLPDQVVSAPSVNAFKNRLDAHWVKLPTLFSPECYE